MKPFLFLWLLNRCSFWENCVWSWRFLKFCVLQRKHECNENECNWTIVPSHSCLCQKFVPESIKVYWRENSKNFFDDSEVTVKTKNALFFINFMNIKFFHSAFSKWTGPLTTVHFSISSHEKYFFTNSYTIF